MHKVTECYVSMSECDEYGPGSHARIIEYVGHELESTANWNADLTYGECAAAFFGGVSSDGTVEQMVRQLTPLDEFR